MGGFEPPTFRLQGECSAGLSYIGAASRAARRYKDCPRAPRRPSAPGFRPGPAGAGPNLVFIVTPRAAGVRLKRLPPKKLKVLTGLFFGSGSLGIIMGLAEGGGFMMTAFGTALVCIGGVTGWMLLTQEPDPRAKRRKRHRRE